MERGDRLINVLMSAHLKAAMNNDNLSSSMVKQVASAGKTFTEAVAAALMTLGQYHAPVTQAREVLFNVNDEDIVELLREGKKIPGYGNSFYHDKIDPAWDELDTILLKEHEAIYNRINHVSDLICQEKGVRLFPNAAAYTAAVAHLMGVDWHVELGLVMLGRLPAWMQQYREYMK